MSWLSWFGVAIGVMSTISACVRVMKIGLYGVWRELIEFYRQALKPIYDLFIDLPLPFDVTEQTVDFAIIYFVLLSTSVRASLIPMLDPEVFTNERMRDAHYYTKIFQSEPSTWPRNMIFASEKKDGLWYVKMFDLRPVWFTISKWILLSLLLWPVISLSPYRKIRLWKCIFRKDGKEGTDTVNFYDTSGRHTMTVKKSYLEVNRRYLKSLIQIIALPLAVIIFFIIAKYNPL